MLALLFALSCLGPSEHCLDQGGLDLAVRLASEPCDPDVCEGWDHLVDHLATRGDVAAAREIAAATTSWSSRWRWSRIIAAAQLDRGDLVGAIRDLDEADEALSTRVLPTELWSPESTLVVRALVDAGREAEAETVARGRFQCSEQALGLLELDHPERDVEALAIARTCPSWEAGSAALAAAALANDSEDDYDRAMIEVRGRANVPLFAEVAAQAGHIEEALQVLHLSNPAYAWDNPPVYAAVDARDRRALLEHAAALPPEAASRILGATASLRHGDGADTLPLVEAAVAAAERRATATGGCSAILFLAEDLRAHPAQHLALEGARRCLFPDLAPNPGADLDLAARCADLADLVAASDRTEALDQVLRACADVDPTLARHLDLVPESVRREFTRAELLEAAAVQGDAALATDLLRDSSEVAEVLPWVALSHGSREPAQAEIDALCPLANRVRRVP